MPQHSALNSRALICITLIFLFIDNAHSLTSLTSLRPNSSSSSAIIRSRQKQQPSTFLPNTSRSRSTSTSTTSLRASSSISTATGEADRAFRLGIQLEKAGLARAASAAFHEAATLYQCFLDHSTLNAAGNSGVGGVDGNTASDIFQHVTSLTVAENNASSSSSSPTVLAVLAYACIRLAHLSQDAFGDSRASKRLYKLAASIDPTPSGVAYHGIGTSVEASITHCFGQGEGSEGSVWVEEMEKAVEAYREASKVWGVMGRFCFIWLWLWSVWKQDQNPKK